MANDIERNNNVWQAVLASFAKALGFMLDTRFLNLFMANDIKRKNNVWQAVLASFAKASGF